MITSKLNISMLIPLLKAMITAMFMQGKSIKTKYQNMDGYSKQILTAKYSGIKSLVNMEMLQQ
jgi:hypothetical protein